ncbi:MAG: hypothetical protein H6647_07395 [Anaerolineales bacterium]|nr:hypothetical protein [Anaerolineales bacterium]
MQFKRFLVLTLVLAVLLAGCVRCRHRRLLNSQRQRRLAATPAAETPAAAAGTSSILDDHQHPGLRPAGGYPARF